MPVHSMQVLSHRLSLTRWEAPEWDLGYAALPALGDGAGGWRQAPEQAGAGYGIKEQGTVGMCADDRRANT